MDTAELPEGYSYVTDPTSGAPVRLGSPGAFATVLLVEHESLGRRAAKVISKRALESRGLWIEVSPFREAGTLVQLNDLHVVRIYDLHETAGSYVLLMEAVQGATFADVIADGGSSVGMRLRLIAQAAKGLAYVHASGLVHRDVKPSNVLVSSEGVVKLADFGLVSSHKADPLRAELDPRAGTKAYQPPEQVDGRGVSPASDVYALGLVAVELLGAPVLVGVPHVRRLLDSCHARRVRRRPRSGYEMLVEFERAADRDLPSWRSAPIAIPVTSSLDTDDTDDDTVIPDPL